MASRPTRRPPCEKKCVVRCPACKWQEEAEPGSCCRAECPACGSLVWWACCELGILEQCTRHCSYPECGKPCPDRLEGPN